jgi:Response regulator receiver domain
LLPDDPCDVVLLDIVMPELDGVSVLEHVKGDPALQDVPVIMISGVDDSESVVRCIEIGADDYLPKPFDPVLLRARISAGLTKKRVHELERERLRGVFARFVPEHVVARPSWCRRLHRQSVGALTSRAPFPLAAFAFAIPWLRAHSRSRRALLRWTSRRSGARLARPKAVHKHDLGMAWDAERREPSPRAFAIA